MTFIFNITLYLRHLLIQRGFQLPDTELDLWHNFIDNNYLYITSPKFQNSYDFEYLFRICRIK